MRGRKHILVFIASLIFAFGLMRTIPVEAQVPYVKVYVESPTGYVAPPSTNPGDYPWYYFQINIYMETSGIDMSNGIVGWGMDLQVNPDVIDLTYGVAYGGGSGYTMYQFQRDWSRTYPDLKAPLLAPGVIDAAAGFWDDVAEGFTGVPPVGMDDAHFAKWPGLPLVMLEFDCNSPLPCLLDIQAFNYILVDGTVGFAEVVVDGFYGGRGRYMSYQGSLLPPGDPSGTDWHELWPEYCKMWDLIDWTDDPDNPDNKLSASDQIHMVNETGWTYHFHVDQVTVTIHFTITSPTTGDGIAEPAEVSQVETGEETLRDPVGSGWHQVYPEFCREFVITSHEDTDMDGSLEVCEDFDFEYLDEPGVTYWAHLDDITTDIIVSLKEPPAEPVPEFPLGVGLLTVIALAIPIVYLWRTRKKEM